MGEYIYIDPLFLDFGTIWRRVVSLRPWSCYSLYKLDRRLGGRGACLDYMTAELLLRHLRRSHCSQSLYRLSYPVCGDPLR
jgi:hypothetical protein